MIYLIFHHIGFGVDHLFVVETCKWKRYWLCPVAYADELEYWEVGQILGGN